MTKIITENIQDMLKYKERIFIVLIASIIFSIGAYTFLIEKAIMNVIAREDVTKETRLVGASVAILEGKYFSVKNDVNIELAHSKGFKDSDVSFFISTKSITAMSSHEAPQIAYKNEF